MSKAVVVLWISLVAVAAGGVISVVRLQSTIAELEGTAAEQRVEQAELADAVERMTQLVRRLMTISAMRADEEQPLAGEDRSRSRRDPPGSLEEQVDDLSGMILPYREMMDQALRRKELREAAHAAAEEDRERYSREELAEIRELYRGGGRGSRGDPKRRQNLETLVEKYPESSVAGCATLQLARGVPAEQAEGYYRKAIQQYSDSYCHGGIQVGALARDRLADSYEENDQSDKAERLRAEIEREYPDWGEQGFHF